MSKTVRKVAGLALVGMGIFISVISFGVAIQGGMALVSAGLTLWASTKTKKFDTSTTNGTELQLSGDPLDVRAVCYGEAWTAGTLRYRNAAGTDNKDLYLVIVLAGHEIDSVTGVEADRNALTLDGSGNVTAPAQYVGLMNVRFYTGTDGQSADATLDSIFSNWTTNHRLRGLAYAVVKLSFDETNLNAVPAFRFKVKGRKVYDPRLDSTNGGSGSHRLATPSTWAWSRNPVLCANDFLRGVKVNSVNIAGLGLADTRFDWANVIAEANVCEENVSLAAGGTQDRYTCDGFLDPRQAPGDLLHHFEMAIAGEIVPSDAKWRFFCGAYRTPTLSLTDKHFIGPLRHIVHKGESETYDTADGRYSALAESGTVVNYAPVELATAVAGSPRMLSLDFQLVADTTDTAGVYDGGARAQRIAKLLLEKEAAGKRITVTTNLYGLRCVPGETVQVTHAAFGLSAQTMRVLEVQLRIVKDNEGAAANLAVDLTLEAGPSSLYAWSAEESALSPAPALPQLLVPWANAEWTPVATKISQMGNTFLKIAGTDGGWDASVRSIEGFHACSVSFRFPDTTESVMVGLNSDPTTDDSYTSIDFAFYCNGADGKWYIYEAGANQTPAGNGTISGTDQFAITYDGLRVKYWLNGTVLRTVPLVGARLYLDSSFYTLGAAVDSLRFGEITHILAGAVGWSADSEGKPSGVRAVENANVDRSALSLVGGKLRIASSGGGFGLPAIPINDSKQYQLTIRYSSTAASVDGLWLGFMELADDLSSGRTHVVNSDGDTAIGDYYDTWNPMSGMSDASLPGTTAVTKTFTYTPTSGTKHATLLIENYTPTTSAALDVEWVALTELGQDQDLLPGVLPPLNTFDLNVEAATEVYQGFDAGPVSVSNIS